MRPRARCARVLPAAVAAFMSACQQPPLEEPAVSLTPVTYAELPGWGDDPLAEALPAWRRSCTRIAELAADAPVARGSFAGPAGAWQPLCAEVAALANGDTAGLRQLVETSLTAYSVADGESGVFTGYFEPELAGAMDPDARYRVPLYRLPDDHVTVDLGEFDPDLAGRRLVGRVEGARLKPYHQRATIDAGALDGAGAELLWLADPLDAFILHVQGSGKVVLPDGEAVRVGFAGHNGHGYTSIGRALIDAGELTPAQADWEGIRAWLDAHPERRDAVLGINPRYIFFRRIEGDGPIGAEGVALTPGRSLAIDRDWMPLGVPVWLDAEHPLPGEDRLQRLMLAQDTGAAINGPVRGDVYWGSGEPALAIAGRMRSQGRYYVLLPNSLSPPPQIARR